MPFLGPELQVAIDQNKIGWQQYRSGAAWTLSLWFPPKMARNRCGNSPNPRQHTPDGFAGNNALQLGSPNLGATGTPLKRRRFDNTPRGNVILPAGSSISAPCRVSHGPQMRNNHAPIVNKTRKEI